jgi:hypothetical protein
VLVQQVDAQLLRPPIAVGGAGACGLAEGTLGFGLFTAHGNSWFFAAGGAQILCEKLAWDE